MAQAAQARKAWGVVRVYTALRDLPELIPLAVLLAGGVGMAGYTLKRMYFGIEGGAIPTREMRADMERQISYGQDHMKPSFFWHVAQMRKDPKDGDIDVGVYPFHNKAYKHDHVQPLHPMARPGVPAEGPSPTEY